MPLPNSALLRPYIQGYIRQEWGYRNEIEAIRSDGTDLGRTGLDQSHLYGGLDAGLTYTLDKMTVGATIYYERSADERTLAGRLGASWGLSPSTSSS